MDMVGRLVIVIRLCVSLIGTDGLMLPDDIDVPLLNQLEITLLARVAGWEAPTAMAVDDQPLVMAVVLYRMHVYDKSMVSVLFEPYQFSTAYLLENDPPEDMNLLYDLAAEALAWSLVEFPIRATHFYSPIYIDEPYWADQRCKVDTSGFGQVVMNYYLLPCQN